MRWLLRFIRKLLRGPKLPEETFDEWIDRQW